MGGSLGADGVGSGGIESSIFSFDSWPSWYSRGDSGVTLLGASTGSGIRGSMGGGLLGDGVHF